MFQKIKCYIIQMLRNDQPDENNQLYLTAEPAGFLF